MKFLFWFSIITLFYLYFGYPALVYLFSRFYKQPVRRKYIYPGVSVLLSVYNEEKNIENKIRSLLSLDYPETKIEFLIGSDGSTDRTEELISRYLGPRVKIFKHPVRSGKPGMLNTLVAQANGEILVLTDARQRLDKYSLKELVRNFTDPKVGSVSAELHFEDERNKSGNGVGFYWRYEKFIRDCESRLGSMLGATGALYAIRKELFEVLPNNLILDDVYTPLRIIQKGYRAIFEPKAKIFDRVARDSREEFVRKARSHAGNFQLFLHFPGYFNPLQGKIGWQFFSHKFLRLMAPFLLAALFVSSAALSGIGFYRAVFISQALFYLFAAWGTLRKNANKLFDVPHMFCVMNTAAVVGLYRFLARKQDVLWKKGEVAHSS